LANVAAPGESQAFVPPSGVDLSTLADRLGLPENPEYVTVDTFRSIRAGLVSGKLPSQPASYAVPGNFTRFLWNLSDQNRTLYWYLFADHTRPPSLDLTRLTVESTGDLTSSQFGNRSGLLIIVVDSAYFDATGDVAQQNVLTARAFVPWDETANRFTVETPTVFPLGVPLYDHARFQASEILGRVNEAGPLRVQLGDRLLRALSFQPSEPLMGSAAGRQAAITYHQLWIPQRGHLQAWFALHPRLFGNSTLGPLRLQVNVASSTGTVVVDQYTLDPMDSSQRSYAPIDIDLSAFSGRTVDLQLAVLVGTASGEGGEVLIGEPRLVVSS
jgi:hypothetical protein